MSDRLLILFYIHVKWSENAVVNFFNYIKLNKTDVQTHVESVWLLSKKNKYCSTYNNNLINIVLSKYLKCLNLPETKKK